MPVSLRNEVAKRKYAGVCLRNLLFNDHVCEANPVTGRLIEWEHSFIYGSHQINEVWAIVFTCWGAHEGPSKNKEILQWIAINQATDADFAKYPRKDWQQMKRYLNEKYGVPKIKTL